MVVTAVLVAQYAGTFDVADMTRFSLRASQPPPSAVAHVNGKAVPGEVVLAADAATTLMARVNLRLHRWDYALGVTGSMSATDLEEQVVPVFVAGANAAQAWHDRSVRVAFTESGSYGVLSAAVPYQQTAATSTTMPTQPGMTGQPTMTGQPGAMQGQTGAPGTTALLGQGGTLTVGSFDAGGSLGWRASTRTAFAVSGGYSLSGGLDAASRSVLPQGYGPHASLTESTILSRSETMSLSLSGSDSVAVGLCTLFAPNANGECREEVPSAGLTASLRHRISATGAVSAGVGVSATVAATPGLNELVIVPTGSVSVSNTVGRRAYALTTSFAPTVDIRTGLPSNRVVVTASLTDRFAPRSTLGTAFSLTQSLPFPAADPFPLTSFSGTVEAKFAVDRRATVGFGLQGYLQHQSQAGPTVGAPGGPEWGASEIAYVSVTANTPTLHF
jgi:hypothetical protein